MPSPAARIDVTSAWVKCSPTDAPRCFQCGDRIAASAYKLTVLAGGRRVQVTDTYICNDCFTIATAHDR